MTDRKEPTVGADGAHAAPSNQGRIEGNDEIAGTESAPRRSFADPLPDPSAESGASGHPGVARGPDDLPSSASEPAKPAGRPDAGPHPTDVTGRESHGNP